MGKAARSMAALDGQTCAVLLFEEPGGEVESLSLVQEVLRVDGTAGTPDAGGARTFQPLG